MTYARLCLLLVLSYVAPSWQQDPIVDFCRRWDHQTALVDSKLYLDGGMVRYNQQSLNYTNNFLLASDLNTPREGTGFPTQQGNLSKPANIPSVSGGFLWADETNKCFYQFGGEYADGASPTDFSMWTYDIVINQWNKTSYTTSDKALQRVSYGAGAQTDSLGSGFYYGGWLNNRTTPGWTGSPLATSGMVRFDYSTGAIKNSTHPDLVGRAEGQMVFVPVSDSGVLVYFGGIEDPTRNGSRFAANMSIINIYDIKSSKWYKQTASGDVPLARRRFCADITMADDRSSFNIYLYGGYGFGSALAFNDVYILSLPSFKWVKAYPLPGADPIPYPDPAGHGGCSANVVRRDQMLVIGGSFPDATHIDCDSPDTQGQHNMILGNNTAKNFMWDLYDPKLSTYAVPSAVVAAIGGGPTGGATVTAPASWDHPDLKNYYMLRPSFSARTATRSLPASTISPSPSPASGSGKKKGVAAIAGGVVGGLAAAILVLCLILFCLHRRKKEAKQQKSKVPRTPTPPVELAVTPLPYEMSTGGPSKFVSVREQPKELFHNPAAAPLHSPTSGHNYTMGNPPIPPSYASGSPQLAGAYPTSNYGGYAQHSPGHQDNAELSMGIQVSARNTPPGQWDQQTFSPSPGGALDHQYSYPTPSSPSQHAQFPTPPPNQVYYPPPTDPRTAGQYSPPTLDHDGSAVGDHYGGEMGHGQSPGPVSSTMATPAQFYAQPAPVGHGGVMSADSRMDDYTHR